MRSKTSFIRSIPLSHSAYPPSITPRRGPNNDNCCSLSMRTPSSGHVQRFPLVGWPASERSYRIRLTSDGTQGVCESRYAAVTSANQAGPLPTGFCATRRYSRPHRVPVERCYTFRQIFI